MNKISLFANNQTYIPTGLHTEQNWVSSNSLHIEECDFN